MSEQLPERVWLWRIDLIDDLGDMVLLFYNGNVIRLSPHPNKETYVPYLRADIADDLLAACERAAELYMLGRNAEKCWMNGQSARTERLCERATEIMEELEFAIAKAKGTK